MTYTIIGNRIQGNLYWHEPVEKYSYWENDIVLVRGRALHYHPNSYHMGPTDVTDAWLDHVGMDIYQELRFFEDDLQQTQNDASYRSQ